MTSSLHTPNVKPGYKQTEVGVIPEDWEVQTLNNVSTISRLAGAEYTSVWKVTPNGEIIALRGFNIGQGKIIERDFVRISNKLSLKLKRSRLCKGDVVYPCVGSIGNAVVIEEDAKYHIQQNIARITPDPAAISSPFLANFLMSSLAEKEVERFTSSSSQPSVLVGSLRQYRVPLPPTMAEQRAIATALSDVDALLDALDRLIAKKRDLKQAAMQQLLTGQTRLPGFHGEWEVKTLGELFNFSGGYSASRDQLSAKGHCYLHYGDIHGATKTCVDARADYQDIPKLSIPLKRVSPGSLLKDGDVVFVDASEDDEGTSRHVVVVNKENVPFISGLHTIVAKSKTDELAHEYRQYCFQTAAIRQQFLFYAVGTKVSGISKSNIPKLTLPVPSVPEQTGIAGVLTDMDAELALLEQRQAKTRALKQGMMQELLTGRTRLI